MNYNYSLSRNHGYVIVIMIPLMTFMMQPYVTAWLYSTSGGGGELVFVDPTFCVRKNVMYSWSQVMMRL